jgi:hypothetical protein
MKIRSFTIALAALLALGGAHAQLVTLVEAIELSPDNMILPGSQNGMVSFRPCAGECDQEHRRARLTQETRFYVDERAVKYPDFLTRYATIRLSKDGYALISVDTKAGTVASIRIQG